MADFSFLSDFSDASESAIDDLLAQTRDLCLLEQLSDINCASFSRADLSADLESRFARLKSLPSAPRAASPRLVTQSSESSQHATSSRRNPPSSVTSPRAASPPRVPPGSELSPHADPPSSAPSPRAARSRRAHRGPVHIPPTRPRSRAAAASEKECSLALQTGGCLFWCSPKKKEQEKKKKRREVDLDSELGWSKSEELLEDLGSFSVEEQRKILRKAMEEQRKISREARKLVKMGRRASVKTSFSSPDLSDD